MTFLVEHVLRLSEHCFPLFLWDTVIIQSWIRFNSHGNFKASLSYCHARLTKGAKQDLWCKNLKLQVAFCYHFEPSVSFETWHKAVSSSIQSKPYANFLVKHTSDKNLASKFPLIQKFLEMDQIQIKFATGSNCCKISEKVSHFLLMCHLQKPYANFCKTWLISS